MAVLRRIDRLVVRVPSVESAVAYYRDVMGLTVVRHERGIAALALGDAELVLHASPDLPEQAVYFEVADVAGVYGRREELRLKFAGPPKQASRGRTATARDPFGNVLLLLDRAGVEAPAVVEAAAPAGGGLFPGVAVPAREKPQAERLAAAYVRVGRTADDLPYTAHFEALHREYAEGFDAPLANAETWRHLLTVRKAGGLPKLRDAKSPAPQASAEEKARLLELLGDARGKRDRLPYTERFDAVVAAFNAGRKRGISPHRVWRLVATLTK